MTRGVRRLIVLVMCLLVFALPLPTHAAAATRIDPKVPDLVRWRWGRLAEIFPDVARPTNAIVTRYGVGWIVSYEQRVIYVNLNYGSYVITDELTRKFAKRAYAYTPHLRKTFKTVKTFTAALTAGVR